MGRTIADLQIELLRTIIVLLAQSPDGATDVARATSVCKVFYNLSEGGDVLRAVNFKNLRLRSCYEQFQYVNGLVSRCAEAGNTAAQHMLAKIILVSSSKWWMRNMNSAMLKFFTMGRFTADHILTREASENLARTAAFIAHYLGDNASAGNPSSGRLYHPELVRSFLCNCSSEERVEIRPHLYSYHKNLIGDAECGYADFFDHLSHMDSYDKMVGHLLQIVKETRVMEGKLFAIEANQESENGKVELDAALLNLRKVVDKSFELFRTYLSYRKEILGETGAPLGELEAVFNWKELQARCSNIAELFETFCISAISASE